MIEVNIKNRIKLSFDTYQNMRRLRNGAKFLSYFFGAMIAGSLVIALIIAWIMLPILGFKQFGYVVFLAYVPFIAIIFWGIGYIAEKLD